MFNQQGLNLLRQIAQRVRGQQAAPRPVVRIDDLSVRAITSRFGVLFQQHAAELARTSDVGAWRTAMREDVTRMHWQYYAAGKGGVGKLDQRDLSIIRAIVNEERGYLDRWGQTMLNARQAGRSLPSEAAIRSRSMYYIEKANATLQRATTEAAGMPPLPAYPKDGTAECRTKDRCRWVIVPVLGGWDCYWRLGYAEHCENCITRARVWNPLRVRNGAIQSYTQETGLFR
jgi:hypothetical protein